MKFDNSSFSINCVFPPALTSFCTSFPHFSTIRIVKISCTTKCWARYVYFLMQFTHNQNHFRRSGDGSSEGFSNLSKTRHLLSGGGGIWTHIAGTLNLSMPAYCLGPPSPVSSPCSHSSWEQLLWEPQALGKLQLTRYLSIHSLIWYFQQQYEVGKQEKHEHIHFTSEEKETQRVWVTQ